MSNHLKLLTLDSKLFTVLPVETVICDRQEGCYAALAHADSAGESTPICGVPAGRFACGIERSRYLECGTTDPAADPAADPVQKLLPLFRENLSRESQASWKNWDSAISPHFAETI